MKEMMDQVKIMKVPRIFEQVIEYDSTRPFRWVIIYFDADSESLKKDKKNRINVVDTLKASIKSATGNDIKQFKYKKLLNKLEIVHEEFKKRNLKIVQNQNDNPNSPWRVVDYQMDKGVSELGIQTILNNVRLNNALENHFELPHGNFKKLFLNGQAVLLLDRDRLEISAGGYNLIEIINNVNWKTKPVMEVPTNEEDAIKTLTQHLNEAPFLIPYYQDFENNKGVFSLEKFRKDKS